MMTNPSCQCTNARILIEGYRLPMPIDFKQMDEMKQNLCVCEVPTITRKKYLDFCECESRKITLKKMLQTYLKNFDDNQDNDDNEELPSNVLEEMKQIVIEIRHFVRQLPRTFDYFECWSDYVDYRQKQQTLLPRSLLHISSQQPISQQSTFNRPTFMLELNEYYVPIPEDFIVYFSSDIQNRIIAELPETIRSIYLNMLWENGYQKELISIMCSKNEEICNLWCKTFF